MTRPQQQEVRRSGRGETDQQGRRAAREAKRGGRPSDPAGPVPEENRPGYHPDREQDRPEGLDRPPEG
ncbi:MAG: hypothetical protein ACJ77A_02260 [Actinomycetota bacterium]